MKTARNIACTIAFATLFLVSFTSANSKSIPQLPEWLVGTWVMDGDGAHTEEYWVTPVAGMMMGMSREYDSTKVRSFEFLRIEKRGADYFYMAQPKGRPATEFKLVEATDSMVVFANPEHDFPKRISYKRIDADHVTARIDDGKSKGYDFPYTRKSK